MTDQSPSSLIEQIRVLVQTAQKNERTLKRFQDVELALIGAQDFASFLDVLFTRLPDDFQLEAVRLWLDDSLPLLRELLEADALDALAKPELLTDAAVGEIAAHLCPEGSPWLGRDDEIGDGRLAALFAVAAHTPAPASAIVLPLAQAGATAGYLCLGSADAERFASGMATDILERFARVVAASLDNVAHREHLKRLGMTDPVTGLANRRYFDERLREEMLRAARHGQPVTCLFADIDHFKAINDTHGHAAGDRALAAVAGCARNQLRVSDTLARYGGEEFAALLLQTDRAGARIVAERIRQAVAELELFDESGRRIDLKVSIGIAMHAVTDLHDAAAAAVAAKALIDEADQAMYRAKRNGRDRVEGA